MEVDDSVVSIFQCIIMYLFDQQLSIIGLLVIYYRSFSDESWLEVKVETSVEEDDQSFKRMNLC